MNSMATAAGAAPGTAQAAMAANLLSQHQHQQATAPQSVPAPTNHMSPAAAAAASLIMAQRNAAHRRRYLGE